MNTKKLAEINDNLTNWSKLTNFNFLLLQKATQLHAGNELYELLNSLGYERPEQIVEEFQAANEDPNFSPQNLPKEC